MCVSGASCEREETEGAAERPMLLMWLCAQLLVPPSEAFYKKFNPEKLNDSGALAGMTLHSHKSLAIAFDGLGPCASRIRSVAICRPALTVVKIVCLRLEDAARERACHGTYQSELAKFRPKDWACACPSSPACFRAPMFAVLNYQF